MPDISVYQDLAMANWSGRGGAMPKTVLMGARPPPKIWTVRYAPGQC